MPVRFEDEEEESDTWPECTVPIAQPLQDEEADETEGDDATGQGEARWGARGVIKKEAETQPREKVPLGDKVGVQTRSRKVTLETAKEENEEALIGAFTLRDYPETRDVQAIYRPWGSELRTIANDMPKVREDPKKIQRELHVIVECHRPSYMDMNILLKLIVPEGLLRQLKQIAGWPSEAPGNRDELIEHINKLIESVTEVAPLKTDWGKIQVCKQRSAEDPLDYLEWLRSMYQRHSELKDEEGVPFAHAFMNGLAVKLQNEIKRVCIGWESKDLMPYVTHCSSLIERRYDETGEAKLMLTQVNDKVNGPVGEM